MLNRLLPATLVLTAFGCAAGSGVVPLGPDTYVVSAFRVPAMGGGFESHRVVLAQAEAFCQRGGRHSLTLQMRPGGDPFTPFYPTAFDNVFRCTSKAAASDAPLPSAH